MLACPSAATGDLLAEQVAAWGGEWRPEAGGGVVVLPVSAGLRRGVVEGRVSIVDDGAGSRVVLELTASAYRLNSLAVLILALGAAGAVALLVWPVFPGLLELAPLAALTALSAWLLVAARLRSGGPQDYLDALAAAAERDSTT